MKITILSNSATILLAVLLFACGGGESTAEKSGKDNAVVSAKPAETPPPAVSAPIQEEVKEEILPESTVKISGKDKVANSDCMSCHYVDKQIIGPAFLDIAAEYANNEENIAMLAEKVIKGGTGVWGETVMPPHASLREDDAKDMVKYILSLK